MSDSEEHQADDLTYTEGEQKLTDVVLEDDLDSNPHNELDGTDYLNEERDEHSRAAEFDSYASHTHASDERGEHESDAEYKFGHQSLSEPESLTPEEMEKTDLKRGFDDEASEEPRLDEHASKGSESESALPGVEREPSSPTTKRIAKVFETPAESNGNEENIRYVKSSKERNGNVENISRFDDDFSARQDRVGNISSKLDKFSRTVETSNIAPLARSKIEDNEMPTKGKVSSLKSLFESNAVHNLDTNKHSSYKHGQILATRFAEYGVGKSSGTVNKGMFH
ncbi:hypothetical protein Tcan_10781 [Toxocara canis]|uniref:Uncharacterized protein n=1 Tax=Toxocara canis TaxID=6265 RepID=A0A0B2UYJ4_TOXCA|nr:hypothetical protein Tcan_10781 [Toxocara canis]